MTLHHLLDWEYGEDGEERLREGLENGFDPDERAGSLRETLLHVAGRRRRLGAVEVLIAAGADLDAKNAGGKTAWAHAERRGFREIADRLRAEGAGTALTTADLLACVALRGELRQAAAILAEHPGAARTGNPEEDRVLADAAGRESTEVVRLLVEAGADLEARGLDDGTALHQAAWFGMPDAARILIEAGAPLDLFDGCHDSSPIGWAVHGSRWSAGAAERVDDYRTLVRSLLDAGSSLTYPIELASESTRDSGHRPAPSRSYLERLHADAPPAIRELLPAITGN